MTDHVYDQGPTLASAERVDEIMNVLEDAELPYRDEAELQYRIAAALTEAGIDAVREVRLSDGFSRIDLMSGDVGIEVKIAGTATAVRRQLARYAECAEISALILVTTRPEQRVENDGAPEFAGKLRRRRPRPRVADGAFPAAPHPPRSGGAVACRRRRAPRDDGRRRPRHRR